MKQLFKRMMSHPVLAGELVAASFFANFLALASPLFVTQILNRYVAQGVDATLFTLTSGVLIAIAMEFAFRKVKTLLAKGLCVTPEERASMMSFAVLTQARAAALERVPAGKQREIVNGVTDIESAYSASNISAVLDVPFALMFLGVLFSMSPVLTVVSSIFILWTFVSGVLAGRRMRDQSRKLQEVSVQSNILLSTAIAETDMVRVFNAGDFLRKAWKAQTRIVQNMRREMSNSQGNVQTGTQTVTALMSVAVIAIAATLVIKGDLDVGVMIGANILATRAIQPIARFAQLGAAFAKADHAQALLDEFARLPLEPDRGSAKADYKGGIEMRDVAFMFPGASTPLFESLSISIAPGNVIVVVGANGVGKTTLARLLVGLVDPVRGQILVDGMDLKQVAPEWWRRQVAYLPQEPTFLNASILDNLRLLNPDIEMDRINRIIDVTGLRRFIDESPKGFDTPVMDNGRQLAVGIRRRLALARCLTGEAKIAIFDEPMEGLDAEGCATVYEVMKGLAQRGATIIAMSHDRNFLKGGTAIIDLNVKPTPEIIRQARPAAEPRPVAVARKQEAST
jgi:ATP-binding cassette subfamily C protein LapB